MNPRPTPALVLALACAAGAAFAALPAAASDLASSASSAGSSASVGSSSASVEASSGSSGGGEKKVAEGGYRIVEVAEAADRPAGGVRLKLEPLQPGHGAAFALVLPQAAYDDSRLGVGDVVQARHRHYGIEFARADSMRPFFLALDDAWHRELRTTPVRRT